MRSVLQLLWAVNSISQNLRLVERVFCDIDSCPRKRTEAREKHSDFTALFSGFFGSVNNRLLSLSSAPKTHNNLLYGHDLDGIHQLANQGFIPLSDFCGSVSKAVTASCTRCIA